VLVNGVADGLDATPAERRLPKQRHAISESRSVSQ
jgi:hypothetical protein